MDGPSLETETSTEPVTAPDQLLALARRLVEGTDSWSGPGLRSAFIARVCAGQDPLGDRYSAVRSAEERRGNGITLTPPRVVQAMLEWARKESLASGKPRRIVDPGAGTGRFAMAAAQNFPDTNVVAVENDPDLLLLLRANLMIAGLQSRVEVIAADFRSTSLKPTDGPTLFIGNPPYVRHHRIGTDWKRWYKDACARHGIVASTLAGLHLHFFAKIAEIGCEGDYGCLITAAEWLDVGYGAALRTLLANGLGGVEIHVLEPTSEAFPGTMTTAAITCFRIGRRPPGLRVRSVNDPSALDRLEGGRTIDWAKASESRKWSLLLRNSPTPSPGTIELGELCRVHRGQVTGSNRIWIAAEHARGLPERFLRPTITRAEELISSEPLLDDDRHLARVIDLPATLDELSVAERKAVDQFLSWAHREGAADGYIARHRSPWWAVRLRNPAPIVCTYMARRVPAFVRNHAGARLLNIAHGIYPREELSEKQLLRLVDLLRTSVRQEQGRTYSGGLTKFEPRELERMPILWSSTDA
jgi:hypothetical protein